MAKFSITINDCTPDEAVEDLLDQIEQVFTFQGSQLSEELTNEIEVRFRETAENISAGLARPEFEKVVEDAKQRVITAIREAFDYQPKKRA